MHCNVGNHVSPFNSHPPRIKALPKTDCMPQLSSVVVGDDLDSHMGVGGQLPPRQDQQQPGMLDHLSGINFSQTLVSAQLSFQNYIGTTLAPLSYACKQEHAGSSL